MKFIYWIIIFVIILGITRVSFATDHQTQVMIVNQVRGQECCSKGSTDFVKLQANIFIKNKIPATFALRYDALLDKELTTYLLNLKSKYPELFSFGILLEITPNLASDSGVKYRGTKDKWFESQYAYTIGYSDFENEKVIDTVVKNYQKIFGNNPSLISSWMVNSYSVNYLQQKYGVRIIQITREQWGTDGLTLYGGPPHYPYPASRNWPFIPDYDIENAPLIIRQTLTDPVRNYGDSTSSHTTQPNDYANDNKNTEYFIQLIKQASQDQIHTGFILLGLENSMEESFQKEFVKQIDFIAKSKAEYKLVFPTFPEITDFWSDKKVTLYWGKDLIGDASDRAYWISSPRYRVRLLVKDGQVQITDIRIYDTKYQDPYTNNLAKKEGFWIVPYIIDGSLWNKEEEKQKIVSPTFTPKSFLTTRQKNDLDSVPTNISFPSIQKGTSIISEQIDGNIELTYKSTQNSSVKFIFGIDEITILGLKTEDMKYHPQTPKNFPVIYKKTGNNDFSLDWKMNGNITHAMKVICFNNNCNLTFDSYAYRLKEMRERQYEYLFPEPISRDIDISNIKLYFHNQYAIAGRNPVRAVISAVDIHNIPTVISSKIEVNTTPKLKYSSGKEDVLTFFDFYSEEPLIARVVLKIDPKVKKEANIFFAPNCRQFFKLCILNPKYIWWYARTIINDKVRLYINHEKQ